MADNYHHQNSLSTYAEHDQVERRVSANLSGVVVDGIDLGQRVSGTGDTAYTYRKTYR